MNFCFIPPLFSFRSLFSGLSFLLYVALSPFLSVSAPCFQVLLSHLQLERSPNAADKPLFHSLPGWQPAQLLFALAAIASWCPPLMMGLPGNSQTQPADTTRVLHRLPEWDSLGTSCPKFPWTSHSSSPSPRATHTPTPPRGISARNPSLRNAPLAFVWPGLGMTRMPLLPFPYLLNGTRMWGVQATLLAMCSALIRATLDLEQLSWCNESNTFSLLLFIVDKKIKGNVVLMQDITEVSLIQQTLVFK